MGYVMAKQYEMDKLSDLMKLTEDGFYEWLTGFEAMDIILATDEIAEIYLSQKKSTAVPKNEGE